MEDGSCPYEVLHIDWTADEAEIRKAYRKLALKYHPDKNPDNQESAEAMFRKIVLASEMLLDQSAKAAYDKVLKAKQAAKLRSEKMDAEHRKAREELEAREQAHKRKKTAAEDLQRDLDAQIRRLRAESERKLQEEEYRFRKLLRQAQKNSFHEGANVADSDYSEDYETKVLDRMRAKAREMRQQIYCCGEESNFIPNLVAAWLRHSLLQDWMCGSRVCGLYHTIHTHSELCCLLLRAVIAVSNVVGASKGSSLLRGHFVDRA
eukprot:gene2933-5738_t